MLHNVFCLDLSPICICRIYRQGEDLNRFYANFHQDVAESINLKVMNNYTAHNNKLSFPYIYIIIAIPLYDFISPFDLLSFKNSVTTK